MLNLPYPLRSDGIIRHHGVMELFDKRHYRRRRVNLAAVVSPSASSTAVIDLSEGGVGLEWSLPDDIVVGTIVNLRFLLAAGQSIEIEGRVIRIANGRSGVEFLPVQQNLISQLLAEARSMD
jgi:hypothetical protein